MDAPAFHVQAAIVEVYRAWHQTQSGTEVLRPRHPGAGSGLAKDIGAPGITLRTKPAPVITTR